MLGIIASAAGFGVVFGLTARADGFSPLEAVVFSLVMLAGASQFAAAVMRRDGLRLAGDRGCRPGSSMPGRVYAAGAGAMAFLPAARTGAHGARPERTRPWRLASSPSGGSA